MPGDRGRYRTLIDGREVTATKARQLGRKGVIVGDRVRVVGDTSGEQGTLALERARSALSRNEVVAALSPEQIAAAANRYIQGTSEGLQNADLLGRLHRAAQEQGVSLTSATPLAGSPW